MVTSDEKSVTYYNIKRKRSWFNRDERVQAVVKED
uniref:Histonelysine Nmethyltransferase SETMARlike [Bombus impatiens] n=1 Tax=Lepeophtheirus salmonis TaxID=72036 RepID=A0A0K2TP73_LEPSM